MAGLHKPRPNIHGGSTHLIASLGNHTFDADPLASNGHARFGGFVFVRFSRVAGKSRSAKIMIYRAPPGGVRAPGGQRNDFTSTTAAWVFFSFLFYLRPGVRAGVAAASRKERIHYADRARSAISLSFLQRVARQNDRAASIYTTCCARYSARRAAGFGPPTGRYINRISREREKRGRISANDDV